MDWENMEKIWTHIFNELNVDPRQINLLMTDSPFATKSDKHKMCDIVFEKFRVKSFQLCNTASMSMYSTGKVSGLVVESGESLSYTVPIFEGYAIPHAMIKLEVAGQDITQCLINELEQCSIKCSQYKETIRGLKEQMCSVSLNFQGDMQRQEDPISLEERSYELPTEEIITVNHRQRFRSSEVIFNPSLLNNPAKGIVEMAFDSIEMCDADLRINLYNNIVLAGGTTLMPGFKERFQMEI
jgi:actin